MEELRGTTNIRYFTTIALISMFKSNSKEVFIQNGIRIMSLVLREKDSCIV